MDALDKPFRQGKKSDKLPYTRLPLSALPTFEASFVINVFNPEIAMESPNHVHGGVEISAIIEGTALFSIDGMEYNCGPGDISFHNAMVPHSLKITQIPFKSIFCHISNNAVASLQPLSQSLKLLNLFFVPLKKGTPVLCNQKSLKELLEKAYVLYHSQDDFGKLKSWSVVAEILANLAGIVYPFQESTNNTENRNREKVLQSLSYIHQNYMHPNLRIAELSRQFSMSESHFASTFAKIMKCPVHEYLNRVRINNALEQLNSGCKKIEEICFDCGFQNYQTFYYIFKKITGQPPAFFKKS